MWYRYRKSTPKEVKGGIKAQSKRGEFAQKWWAKRWISALETFNDSARLRRGRSYARKGQVLSIDIRKGVVEASVQGSRKKPYRVVIETSMLSEEAWRQVIELLTTQAVYAAKLMAGEMPTDIETIFDKSNISLLPSHHEELQTDCSCPDWSNPCKHVAAVFYLLGEEFDRDPFLIFTLRGMDRETFIDLLEKGSEAVTNLSTN
ncbi:MAG: SWIM zinc finger family protein, partial [Waddliaceae bacterium]